MFSFKVFLSTYWVTTSYFYLTEEKQIHFTTIIHFNSIFYLAVEQANPFKLIYPYMISIKFIKNRPLLYHSMKYLETTDDHFYLPLYFNMFLKPLVNKRNLCNQRKEPILTSKKSLAAKKYL